MIRIVSESIFKIDKVCDVGSGKEGAKMSKLEAFKLQLAVNETGQEFGRAPRQA